MSNQLILSNGCVCSHGCPGCDRLAEAWTAMREALRRVYSSTAYDRMSDERQAEVDAALSLAQKVSR